VKRAYKPGGSVLSFENPDVKPRLFSAAGNEHKKKMTDKPIGDFSVFVPPFNNLFHINATFPSSQCLSESLVFQKGRKKGRKEDRSGR
jgi:hypothetical protein